MSKVQEPRGGRKPRFDHAAARSYSWTTQPQHSSDEVAYLFVDLSNVWFGLRAEAERRGDPDRAVRMHAENLYRVLAAGREVGDAVLVANRTVPEAVLRHFLARFRVELVECGSITGTEQGADELLQNAIYRTVLRHGHGGVIVVATGDGAGWQHGRGFCAALAAARRLGFGIDVVSFAASLNGRLRRLADALGALVLLDRFYESIAFLEGRHERDDERPRDPHRPPLLPTFEVVGSGDVMRARSILGLMLLVLTVVACGGSQAISDVQRVWCSAHPAAVIGAGDSLGIGASAFVREKPAIEQANLDGNTDLATSLILQRVGNSISGPGPHPDPHPKLASMPS